MGTGKCHVWAGPLAVQPQGASGLLQAAQVSKHPAASLQFLVQLFIVGVERGDLFPDSVGFLVLTAGIKGFTGIHFFSEAAASPLFQSLAMAG